MGLPSGERDDAFAVQEQVVAGLRRTLGTDDPTLLRAQATLDLMLRDGLAASY